MNTYITLSEYAYMGKTENGTGYASASANHLVMHLSLRAIVCRVLVILFF